MRADVRILAVREGVEPIAFAVVERAGPAAEITGSTSVRTIAAAAAPP
jgi:hypothetical protein